MHFTGLLEEDACRRDFSVNALYRNIQTGEIIDPTGGLSDLRNRVLRTTSRDPEIILRDDGLRILRLIRFAVQTGFSIEEATWQCACKNAALLDDIAWESIVGDCMGKYHPHGDGSVYDAMVRLAQDFSTRYPLVDGQGNFGSVDGDGAAAMRYTEARLSKMAVDLMRDIDKDTVDFQPNFDGSQQEPTVLPARFPNLLVNGSNGIAVGMATNMPPHNLGEAIDGLVALIDNPDITTDELMTYIPGPDFPTGAVILGRQGIAQAYRTGRGKIYIRAKTEIEQMSASKSRIIVTEIPYQVNKAGLVSRIADLVHEKRIEGISDLRDETDRNGTRIVIELKKDVNANVVLNNLYKHTDLQSTFGVINLALVDGTPKILTLKEILYYYLEHQKDVVTRRTRFDLGRAKERLHIIEGLLKALDHIDEARLCRKRTILSFIRTSKGICGM